MKDVIRVGRWAEFPASHPLVGGLKARMTMTNPEYEKNERLGFPNERWEEGPDGERIKVVVPKIIRLYEEAGDWVRFPRAVVHPMLGSSSETLVDETVQGEPVEIPSLIKLRPHQEPFVDKLEAALRSQYGAVGQAEAGFGKTVCSLELMSRLGLKTVILVHKEFLMTQWIHRMLGTKAAASFLGVRPSELSDKIEPPMLGIEPEDIGIVLQGRCEWEDKKVVVAMVQSLTSGREYPKEFYESFGLVMVDECVHGDTEVLTREGYRRAADVYADWVAGRPIQLLVPTPAGMVSYPVTYAWEREKPDSVVVETKTGERIRVSREHEFRVVDAALRLSWKRADELRPGDYIVSPRRPIDSSPRLFDREGYFLGLFVGDGHYLSEGKVRFTVRKDVEAWRKALAECGVSYRESTNTRGDVSFVVEGEAVEWVRRMGFRPGRKTGRIGWLGLTYGRSEAWTVSFLRGLFDTEGSVISDRVQLSMTDETLLREVHRTLRLLGIEGKLVLRPRTNPKHQDVAQISLFGPAARTFFDVVGFGFDRKRQTEMIKGKAGDGVFVGTWLDALAAAGLKYGYLSEISGIHRSKLTPSGPQRLSHACVRRLIQSVDMYLDTLDTSSWDEVNRYKLVTYEMVAEAVGTSTASVWREPERFKDTYQRLAEQRVRSLRRVLEQASWVQTAWIEVVRSVEGAPGGKFYDFEVPVEHRFVANGLEVHNCHRFAAPVFRQSIVKFPAAKRLGVTATPKRNDGLEPVFFAHIGQIAAVGKGDRAKPRVNRIQTPVRATPAIHRKVKVRGRENLARIINYLVEYDARNRQIVKLLVKAAENGRKILVLSHRVAHVEELRRQFIEACRTKGLPVSTAYYVGGMDLKERANAEKMQVLFATYQMAEEGLDVPELDTLFLTTPIGDVEQAVGRILRVHDEKMTPVVVDFVDTAFKMTTGLANKRKREYEAKGWLN